MIEGARRVRCLENSRAGYGWRYLRAMFAAIVAGWLLVLVLASLAGCASAPAQSDPCEGLPPLYGTDC